MPADGQKRRRSQCRRKQSDDRGERGGDLGERGGDLGPPGTGGAGNKEWAVQAYYRMKTGKKDAETEVQRVKDELNSTRNQQE